MSVSACKSLSLVTWSLSLVLYKYSMCDSNKKDFTSIPLNYSVNLGTSWATLLLIIIQRLREAVNQPQAQQQQVNGNNTEAVNQPQAADPQEIEYDTGLDDSVLNDDTLKRQVDN